MRIVVPLIAVLVPAVITPGLLFHFDITPKVAILLYGMSILALFPRKIFESLLNLFEPPVGRWFGALMCLQLGSLALATVTSGNPTLSLYGSEWRRLGLAAHAALILYTLLAAGWAQQAGNLTRLLRCCVGTGAGVAIYTIGQYLGWDPILPAAAYHAGEGPFTIVRPPGTLAHADYLAPYLIFACFCAIALARREQLQRVRRAVYGAVALTAVAVLLSGTRAGLAGLAAGCLVLFALGPKHFGKRQFAVTVAALALLAAFWVSPAGTKLRARVHWSADDPWGGARLFLWRDTVNLASPHLAAGLGPEVFALEFPRSQSVELARAYPDFYHESPHNSVLDALVTQGLAGPLLFAAIWGVSIFAGFRGWRHRANGAAPLLAGATALMVDQQFSVFTIPTMLSFYLMEAMLVGIAPGRGQGPAPASVRFAASAWAALIVLSAIPLAILASRLVVADYALETARQSIERGDLPGARSGYRSHLRWAPTGATSDLYYSRALASMNAGTGVFRDRLETTVEAIQAGARAARYSEQRANAWYSLATLFATQGDDVSVERCLRSAIAWAPNWFKPHWALARLLRLSGRSSEAQKEAEKAVDLSGGRYSEVTATFDELTRESSQH